jgi:hypothetical protein
MSSIFQNLNQIKPELLPEINVSLMAFGEKVYGKARIQPGARAQSSDGTVFYLQINGQWTTRTPDLKSR